VALVAAAGVLCFGLIPPVAGWDNILLSESLSTSLLVLLIALLLLTWRRPTAGLIAATLGVATLWMFTRQDDVVIFLGLLPFLIAFVFWRRGLRSGLPVVAVLIAIGLWGAFAITRSGDDLVVNWNSLQIIENRIVPHPMELRFFVARGLPVTPTVLAERGAFPGHTSPLFHDPRVMNWVEHHFKSAYLAYLVQHLPASVGGAFAAAPFAVTGPTAALIQVRPVLPAFVVRLLWSSEGALAFWLALAAALAALCIARHRSVRCLPVIGLLLLAVLLGSILTWNLTGYPGDTGGDLPRLFMPVAVMLRLGTLLTIAVCAEAAMSGSSPPPTNFSRWRRMVGVSTNPKEVKTP
jgi:hypothetical protein